MKDVKLVKYYDGRAYHGKFQPFASGVDLYLGHKLGESRRGLLKLSAKPREGYTAVILRRDGFYSGFLVAQPRGIKGSYICQRYLVKHVPQAREADTLKFYFKVVKK